MSLQRACYAVVDGFTNMGAPDTKRREIYMELVASILSIFLSILVIAFVGKWLWNNSVVELIAVARPVHSVWQIIGLMIFISLIR